MSLLDSLRNFVNNIIPFGTEDELNGFVEGLDDDFNDIFDEYDDLLDPDLP